MHDLWIKAAEETKLTAALLLDLSAAFDVVDHHILLEKLKLYKFSEKSIAWFKSYLENRKQVVIVESKQSDPKEVGEQGVPQGSLLGPILFIIFYNDFPDVREEGDSVFYADDDTDNVSDASPDLLEEKIQIEANKSTAWVHDNRLVCSGAKTKLLVIGTKELRKSKLLDHNRVVSINVDGHIVAESESERLLGLIVNNTLTWEHHLYGNEDHRGLIPKLSQRAGIIRKLSFIMPQEKLKTIAEGIFFSLMNYCIEIFGNVWGLDSYDEQDRHSTAFRKEDNAKLQILMNKVLRSLTGMDSDTPVSVLTAASGQLSVHQRTALFTLTSVHKAMKSKEPSYSFAQLSLNQPHPETGRYQANCSRTDYKLSISRAGYFYRGSRLYNQIPNSLANTSKQSVFKTAAKQWVRDNVPLHPP